MAVLVFSPACYQGTYIMNAMPITKTIAVLYSAFDVLP